MNILFIHREFPAQFKQIIAALLKVPDCNIMFITTDEKTEIPGVIKFCYKPTTKSGEPTDNFLSLYDDILTHARGAANVAKVVRDKGIKPDLIYSFNFWGVGMFMKDIFPDVPLISYCEWFYNYEGADACFDGRTHDDDYKFRLRCNNSHMLIDLYSADLCITPTNWQKQQFPKEFHSKFRVIHDGINTGICKPNPDAEFLGLSAKDEVITYGTRGMEPYRGFIQFMEAAEILLKKRPNAHIVIPGHDAVYYSEKLPDKTYKEYMLEKLDLDMDRIHFVGPLSYLDYIKFLQISSVHVYSTYPTFLSWSLLDAMSAGCCVVASNTAPVLEVVKDGYNGILFDFFNVEQLVEKVEYVLDNQSAVEEIRKNARQTIVETYDANVVLQKHSEIINEFLFR